MWHIAFWIISRLKTVPHSGVSVSSDPIWNMFPAVNAVFYRAQCAGRRHSEQRVTKVQ
jgi:hypothetical protein